MPEANITLVAKWEEQEVIVPPTMKEYTITLDVNGGNTLAQTSITAEAGAPIVISTPTREGYNFLGWYNGAVEFKENVMPEADINLVAKWEEIEIPVVQDTVLPIIDVEGGLETKLNWGKEFNPLKGVTANDNVDGDVRVDNPKNVKVKIHLSFNLNNVLFTNFYAISIFNKCYLTIKLVKT